LVAGLAAAAKSGKEQANPDEDLLTRLAAAAKPGKEQASSDENLVAKLREQILALQKENAELKELEQQQHQQILALQKENAELKQQQHQHQQAPVDAIAVQSMPAVAQAQNCVPEGRLLQVIHRPVAQEQNCFPGGSQAARSSHAAGNMGTREDNPNASNDLEQLFGDLYNDVESDYDLDGPCVSNCATGSDAGPLCGRCKRRRLLDF